MHPVRFGPAARAELLEAMDWYEDHVPGLGEAFLAEVDATVTRIAEAPQRFPEIHRHIRRARLRRFPYGLFFVVEDSGIHVLACFHSSRDPQTWRDRA